MHGFGFLVYTVDRSRNVKLAWGLSHQEHYDFVRCRQTTCNSPCLKKGIAGCDATAARTLSSPISCIAKAREAHANNSYTFNTPLISCTSLQSRRINRLSDSTDRWSLIETRFLRHMTLTRFHRLMFYPKVQQVWHNNLKACINQFIRQRQCFDRCRKLE